MKKNFDQIFSTIEIDPVTDRYHITIPEEIINELDWYEEMVLKWNIENDDKLDIMKIEMEFHNKAQGIAEGALHKNHVFYPHFREIG